ncbi:hypothetical protein ACX0FC_18440, partial [Enterococcus faecium]
ATGAQKWRFDPHLKWDGTFQHLTCRGVSAFTQAGAAPAATGGACATRIFEGTNDARLIALDAATGQPCQDFGDHGTVDLNAGMPE